MKLIILYLKTLKRFFRINVMASIVLFVSIALVFISSMYFINAFMSYKSSLSEYYRIRTIKCKYNEQQNQLDFLDFPEKILALGKENIENIVFRYNDEEINNSLAASLFGSHGNEEEELYASVFFGFSIVSYYDNRVYDEYIKIGENIKDVHVEKSEFVIVYNNNIDMQAAYDIQKTYGITDGGNMPEELNVGNTINIMGKEYIILGIRNNFAYSMIPYTTGLENLKLSRIDVVYNEEAMDEEKQQLSDFISTEYYGLDVSAPPKINEELFRKGASRLFLLGVTCFMGIFYLLYIYKYIIKINRKTIIINRMLGLSTSKSTLMILFQIFVINTVVYIVTALLHRFALVNIFDLLIPDTIFYIIIYLFVILMSSIIIYPFAKKISEKISSGGIGEK